MTPMYWKYIGMFMVYCSNIKLQKYNYYYLYLYYLTNNLYKIPPPYQQYKYIKTRIQ